MMTFFAITLINFTEPMPIPNAVEITEPELLPPINESKTSPEMLPISPNIKNNEPNMEKIAEEQINIESQQDKIENYIIPGIIITIITIMLYRQNIIRNKFSRIRNHKLR